MSGIRETPAPDWQPIATAPKDGTAFQAQINGHEGAFQIRWEWGFVDSAGKDCGSWVIDGEQEPPACWTDGVCWDANDIDLPSERPTHWMPLPEPPVTE